MSQSFRDGLVLCALVHFMRVDSMNYVLLTPVSVHVCVCWACVCTRLMHVMQAEPHKNIVEALNKGLAYVKVRVEWCALNR
jgi:hypothetical protein